ncbi:hypothetical protein NOCA2480018 [metagenome]|uniref:Uncharacterized protein n=1 Tax=metagenome TaxID=256318 RepID=A0A2P2C7G2_9ZZZZ
MRSAGHAQTAHHIADGRFVCQN